MKLLNLVTISYIAYSFFSSQLFQLLLLDPKTSPATIPDILFGSLAIFAEMSGARQDISKLQRNDTVTLNKHREGVKQTNIVGLSWLGDKNTKDCFNKVTCSVTKLSIPSPTGHVIGYLISSTKNTSKKQKMIVHFHGGGGVVGDAESGIMSYFLAPSLEATILTVEYALAPENPYPAGVNDGVAVLEWLMTQGNKYNFDPNEISLAGESGGALIAAAVAQKWRDSGKTPSIHTLLLFIPMLSPVISRSYVTYENIPHLPFRSMGYFWDMYATNIYDCVIDPVCSPGIASVERLKGIAKNAFVLTGLADCLHDEGVEYARKLKLANVNLKFFDIPGTHAGALIFSDLHNILSTAFAEF